MSSTQIIYLIVLGLLILTCYFILVSNKLNASQTLVIQLVEAWLIVAFMRVCTLPV